MYLRQRSFDFFFFFSGTIKHGDGVAIIINKFTKTKAATGACFLTYLNLLGASVAIQAQIELQRMVSWGMDQIETRRAGQCLSDKGV